MKAALRDCNLHDRVSETRRLEDLVEAAYEFSLAACDKYKTTHLSREKLLRVLREAGS